jgi:hypothetical protein
VEGDLTLEGLGLSPAAAAAVSSETHVVVHAASLIELEADAQRTLRGNYLGTKRLLLLAGRMPGLRALVAVSSTAANVNAPPGSYVDECIYPLYFGSQEVGLGGLGGWGLGMGRRVGGVGAERCWLRAARHALRRGGRGRGWVRSTGNGAAKPGDRRPARRGGGERTPPPEKTGPRWTTPPWWRTC